MSYTLREKLNTKGITLLEVIVVIGIFSILSVGATWLLMRSNTSNAVLWEDLMTQGEGRKVLNEIVNEVRKAEESSIGSYPIDTADDDEFIFYVNIDSDSMRERVHYWLDGTTLKRGVIKPSGNPLSYVHVEEITELAHDVKNGEQGVPVFLYYDEDYTGTESALEQPVSISEIRMVRVQLELEKDPTKTPVPLHVESVTQVRSLKDN